MKQLYFHTLLIAILLIMAFPLQSSGDNKPVDFNFPQDVSKDALTDLNQALKSGDGEMTVNALIRYSLAESAISQDNMPNIIDRIDKVIKKEKTPHIKALLYQLEALAYQGYRNRFARGNRNNPVDERPADISEWDRSQFDSKIIELVNMSLAEPEALKQIPVTSLPKIIRCDELGATYVPTLLQFMAMSGFDLMENTQMGKEVNQEVIDLWLKSTEDNAPAHIYALIETHQSLTLDDYKKYQDSEFSGLILKKISIYNRKEKYQILTDHVARFPDSDFTLDIKNMLTELESKTVSVTYPDIRTPQESIPISIDTDNANSFDVNIYSVPSELLDSYYFSTSNLKLCETYPTTVQGNIPFSDNTTKMTLPPLPYGAYLIYAEGLGKGSEVRRGSNQKELYNDMIMRVTDLALFSIRRDDGKDHIGAVNIKTGKPLPGVTVNYYRRYSGEGTLGVTDANGLIVPPKTFVVGDKEEAFTGMTLQAIKGDDKYSKSIDYRQQNEYHSSSEHAEFYTDLGVYRPGETIHWAAIAYHESENGRRPICDEEMEVIFNDYNHKSIDTIKVKTDSYGRCEGTFIVPKDRMNGQFSIILEYGSYYKKQIGREYVNVSEYKAPTFEVSFPDTKNSYFAGQPVEVIGKLETYSGMPVANAQVKLSLKKNLWSWWWRDADTNGEHLMDTIVTTDGKGIFTFSYEPDLFYENRGYTPGRRCWSHYSYRVVATATTDAGETQEGTTSFIIGSRRGLEMGYEESYIYLNDKPIEIPLIYNTTDEENTSVWCTWEVTPIDGTEPVKTGNLNTDDPTIDLTALPSGTYNLKVHILDADEGEEDVDVNTEITIYRKSDKTPPVKDCPMWIAPQAKNVDKNNLGHINIGVSTPRAYIYYVASTTEEVISEGWLNYTKGWHDFTVPLPKRAGANVNIQFVSYYDMTEWYEDVTLENPYLAEAVKITATSFRDKLTPGDIEHWTFTLTDQNDKPLRGAMLLDMFDEAIATITSNDWGFGNWGRYSYTAHMNLSTLSGKNTSHAHWTGEKINTYYINKPIVPYLYTYSYPLFGTMMGLRNGIVHTKGGYRENGSAMGSAPTELRSPAVETRSVDMDYMTKEDVIVAQDEAAGAIVNEKNLEKVILRENDVKTALWQPMLTSDKNGNINVEFEVPNFNTTWIAQAVAWDKNMRGTSWMAEVLTQKPLMVRSNMPRFLRQGDKAQLAATVQNATDAASACDAVIEMFDPRSGDIYATRKFNLQLDSMGSQTVAIDWQVPDSISMAGFRIKAANGRFGDGEQVMVPVLTTISPVIETAPFYIEAAQNHFEAPLPPFPNDARVTLEYCDNPIWYCVLALPTIFDDNCGVATRAAHSLFALEVAQGVAKSQPQIKEAITYWKQHDEDSTLVSMLTRNQDLKINTLLASPWVRDADRQTLRMSQLNELFDETIASNRYEKLLATLQSLQMSDGGFTWYLYPECRSSLWITGEVLEILGDIKFMGFLPDDSRMASMIDRAIKYYDRETVTYFNKIRHYEKEPYRLFTDYAYIRTLFPEKANDKASADLLKKTLKYMNKNWSKGLSIKEKGFYAMTLNRNGYQKAARSIIESIRQYAITKPSLGMYWDNLQTGRGWWELDKVAYTCTILRAMNEVDPRQDEIDQVRKWMLLMKQSNDWGSYSLAADAVYSILGTGSQWLDRGQTPNITVAGQPINLDKMSQWLGYFRTSLPATTTGNVVIDRTGKAPAWGSIYSQYKAPMSQIQEKSIEEISISKDYYVYGADGSLHSATSFKVGDKVKVRVIIKTNKDMDYVTITDERASCFEPVDQLSGYRNEDNTWFYLETKDSQTNTFFSSLRKGTHIIGYDVWVTNPGEFTSGIATVQCQYAPQLSAHSAGKSISVVKQ